MGAHWDMVFVDHSAKIASLQQMVMVWGVMNPPIVLASDEE